jgi:hypothetical protein
LNELAEMFQIQQTIATKIMYGCTCCAEISCDEILAAPAGDVQGDATGEQSVGRHASLADG